jgi:NAD(P)-dependent dehydrogenase (short-subunit alcohol dehydrogenase family)
MAEGAPHWPWIAAVFNYGNVMQWENVMLSLKDKVAFMSGAGSVGDDPEAKVWGNGKATAVLLARQGAKIYGVDLRKGAADVTKAIIDKEGGSCVTRGVDMTKAKEVEAAVADCMQRFGRIDILVNNIGGSAPGNAVTMTEEVWDAQISHNLKTVFLGCKYVLPIMEKQGKGAIVNLASVAGLRMTAERAHVAYSTTKLGILAFSKSTAISYARKGIRCNTVIPGLMHTALVEHRLAKTIAANDLQGLIDKRHAQCPTGKMGDAWDIAHAVLFLVSDEARYITATEIVVDGGLTAGSGLG